MAPRCIRPQHDLQDEIRRLARVQTRRALRALDDPRRDLHGATHFVRRRCKQLRGLIRLVRPCLKGDTGRRENAAVREAQGLLSGLRDQEARVETLDRLMPVARDEERHAVHELRRLMVQRRDAWIQASAPQIREAHDVARDTLAGVRRRAKHWVLTEEGFDALEPGLRRCYGDCRRALDAVLRRPEPEVAHEWRKRVKDHLHHVRLLRGIDRPTLDLRRALFDQLAEVLGELHDLDMLRAEAEAHPPRILGSQAVDALHALLDRQGAVLRARAVERGRPLHADRPKALARRWRSWYEARRAGTKGLPPFPSDGGSVG